MTINVKIEKIKNIYSVTEQSVSKVVNAILKL